MASIETTRKIALAVTCVYVLAVLFIGLVVIQQLLLSVFIALLGVVVYLVWRILWGAGPKNGNDPADAV
jgi:hypothetical protein